MDNKLSDNILTGLDGEIEVNGKLNQTHVLSGAQKQEQYQLSYEALEITGDKNYFLSYLTYEDGTVHTYFFPIQFVGPQKIVFDVPFPVANIQFFIYGNIRLKDTKLQSVLDNTLTEEQKQSLNKVSSNSDYWDRIIAVTSALGNILTNKLEGSINTALNSIAGSEGRMYWEDGKFICRDGKTDAESTMAMLLSPAGFMIANSKLDDGNWNWRTFGTGAGFTADEIIAGTLRAIAIESVSIIASTITGGKIIGTQFLGGSLNIADKYIVDSDGHVQMLGEITWGADNSPVKAKYSSDNKNWHYNFESNDTFAKYSYDGGLTWTEGIKIRGTDGIDGQDGAMGPQGVPGINGTNGKTLYTWIRYADDAQGNGISQYPNNKKYIGFSYNQESPIESNIASHYKWSLIEGEQGIPGIDGEDGKTYYTWLKYADTPTSGMSDSPTGKKYMGLAYNRTTSTESTNYADYQWSLIKGDKGDKGDPGLPGINGVDGKTYFTWIKYADDINGKGMSDNPSGKTYIGMAYNKETNVESSNPMDYTWSKFVGADGLDGADGLPGTNGLDGKTYYAWIRYADDINGNGLSNTSTGKAYIGIAYNKETATESNNPKDYTWTKIKGETGPQGNTGPQGPQGPPGSDANVPSYIQSTKITGTRVESCELAGNTITGSTIKGSTMIGGNEQSVYTKIDPTNPLAVYRPTGKVAELWGAADGSSYLILYDRNGVQKVSLISGANQGSTTSFTDTGSMHLNISGELQITGQSGFKVRAWNRADPYLEIYRSYMNVGHPSAETWIDGSTVYINSKVAGYAFSENDVRMMELEYENKQLGLKQSEMEVVLMERGIL